jgi:hypothetical protein
MELLTFQVLLLCGIYSNEEKRRLGREVKDVKEVAAQIGGKR